MRKIGKETAGFTLIELMVALALVGLVIMGGFSLYFFADRSFVSGTVMADIQADVQLAMQRITNELRLAHSIEFGKAVPSEGLSEDDHYLFVNNQGLVVLRTQRGDQILTATNLEVADYQLSFSNVAEAPNALRIELTSLNKQIPYSLASEIQVLNIRLGGFEGIAPSDRIYFTKTLSIVEREEANRIRRRCILSTVIFDDQDPDLDVFRHFRDSTLQKTEFGRKIVRWYYGGSLHLAPYLERMPLVQIVVKGFFRMVAMYLRWQDLASLLLATSIFALSLVMGLKKRVFFS